VGKKGDLNYCRFPLFRGNTAAVKHINAFLQSELLSNDTVQHKASSAFKNFRELDSVGMVRWGYESMEYSIGVNSPKLFSMKFEAETIAAYPEHHVSCFSFDSKTGEPITFSRLFSESGLQAITRILSQQREKRVAQYIKENYADSQEIDYIKQQYSECLADSTADELLIRPESVLFHRYYCFPHAERPFDTDLDITIPISELQPFLSSYGKKLLITTKAAK
jgi:hypothetical protein